MKQIVGMLPNILCMCLPRVVFQDRDVVHFELLWKQEIWWATLTKIFFHQFSELNFNCKFQFKEFRILRKKD